MILIIIMTVILCLHSSIEFSLITKRLCIKSKLFLLHSFFTLTRKEMSLPQFRITWVSSYVVGPKHKTIN